MKNISYTLAMFRIYRILVQCLNRNKKMLERAPKYLEIINDIKAILENKVIEPFEKWFTDNNPNEERAIKYIDLYFKEVKKDNMCSDFDPVPVDTVKKFVERSMKKYDKENLSKKDQI